MHLRLEEVLPPSSTRTIERKRESIPNKACKALIDPASLLTILNNIYQWANETIRQLRPAQSFADMNTVHDSNLNTRTTHSNNQEREEIPPRLEEENIEDISIHFLCACSIHPNWKQIVSSRNEYGQTMAHISVTLGYFRLLQHLCTWEINLNATDHMGSTALHYAYLFRQEECAKVLIHSGVDQSILDDLGRSPSDLDPSLEVIIYSNVDMDSGSSADGGPPIECDTEIPDEAGMPYAEHSLIQPWMLQGEGERRGEVRPSRCQTQEISSLPAPDHTDARVWGATYDRSSYLYVRSPEGHSTPVVAEETDMKGLIEEATPPHLTLPPSPISEFSPQTQEVNRPSDTGQSPFSHRTPLGDYRRKRTFRPLSGRESSLVSTNMQGDLRLSYTSGDIKERNVVNDEKLLQHSGNRPESTLDEQLLCDSDMLAMRTANITPVPVDIWDVVRWENVKEVISSRIVAGEADSQSVDNDLQAFILKVAGTHGDYQCVVPMGDSEGGRVYCGFQLRWKHRILRHIKDTHLQYRPFVCGGKCGDADWYYVL